MPVVAKVMVEAPEPAVKLHVPLQVDARAAAELGRGALATLGQVIAPDLRARVSPLP